MENNKILVLLESPAKIKMYQAILRDAQKQIYYWKNFWYESQSKENLLQGYKKVIQHLSDKLRRKDS